MAALTSPRGWASVVVAVVRRPDVWITALRAVWAARREHWITRPPFLPVPDARWVRWRVTTVYGEARVPDPDHVVEWLRWRRQWAAVTA